MSQSKPGIGHFILLPGFQKPKDCLQSEAVGSHMGVFGKVTYC